MARVRGLDDDDDGGEGGGGEHAGRHVLTFEAIVVVDACASCRLGVVTREVGGGGHGSRNAEYRALSTTLVSVQSQL